MAIDAVKQIVDTAVAQSQFCHTIEDAAKVKFAMRFKFELTA